MSKIDATAEGGSDNINHFVINLNESMGLGQDLT